MGSTNSTERETSYVPHPKFVEIERARAHDLRAERDYDRALQELPRARASAQLGRVNLIVGIDFSTTNLQTGDGSNLYRRAIAIIQKLWSRFHVDAQMHCYGFGNASTLDHDVFSFHLNEGICNGFGEAFIRYKQIAPHIRISGPVSFAPIIEMAMTKAVQIGGQYNVLLIIADSQAFGGVDIENGRLSPQEEKTIDAIVEASEFPLSIILVVVGDGPWDRVKAIADKISARAGAFDNFQLVNFTKANSLLYDKEIEFCSALMKIPRQYEETKEHNITWDRRRNAPMMIPFPPPDNGAAYGLTPSAPYLTSDDMPAYSTENHINQSYVPRTAHSMGTPSVPNSTSEDRLCLICLSNLKDMAFGCGHQTCCDCGPSLDLCPICRSPIQTRIKLY